MICSSSCLDVLTTCLCVCEPKDRAPLYLCRSRFWELRGKGRAGPSGFWKCAFSVSCSAAAFGVVFGDLETVAVCILFPYCTASKWLRFIKDLRLHLIVLIIFLRVCSGGVAGVEPDTLLVDFELHFRSLCGFFGTLLFSKH